MQERFVSAGLRRNPDGNPFINSEARLLLENIACQTVVASDHYTNYLDLSGNLPQDKARPLSEIDRAMCRDESSFRPFFVGRE